MPDLRDICSVVSHELRAPLAVLQGYLRMHQRSATPLDAVALAAMLEATARLTAVSRQTSDLARWLARPGTSLPAPPTLAAVVTALRESPHAIRSTLSADPSGPTLAAPASAATLAGALATVADAVAREHEVPTATITLQVDSTDVVCTITPSPTARPLASDAALPVAWYQLGGHGLGLVNAAVILDALGITVSWSMRDTPAVVRLPVSEPA